MNNDIYDFIPQWIEDLIKDRKATYGGGVYVKTPVKMKGLRVVSVCIPDRAFADNIEKIAKMNGWFPISYRQWDNGSSGTISFRKADDCFI